MKWTNGLTWQEKDKKKDENRGKWHIWFAWFPVTIGLTTGNRKIKVWLEYVQRKGEHVTSQAEDWWSWEYREIV